jgi:hypothetical protein
MDLSSLKRVVEIKRGARMYDEHIIEHLKAMTRSMIPNALLALDGAQEWLSSRVRSAIEIEKHRREVLIREHLTEKYYRVEVSNKKIEMITHEGYFSENGVVIVGATGKTEVKLNGKLLK